MLTPAAAAELVAASLALLPVDACPLAAAGGRVLREDLLAERDQPPFDRVAMDGIAIASEAWQAGRREYRVTGTVAAGAPPMPLAGPTTCLEVMTGAVLPPGADAVIPYEWLTLAGGQATAGDGHALAAWANVHRRGVDAPAGARVLGTGTRLRFSVGLKRQKSGTGPSPVPPIFQPAMTALRLIRSLHAPAACAPSCGRDARPRPPRAHGAPMASRSGGEASFRERYPRVASSS